MDERKITANLINDFARWLHSEGRAAGTVENYLRHVRRLAVWLGGEAASKRAVNQWKEELLTENYTPVSVNAMLAAVNQFFKWAGWQDCRVRALRIQKQVFRPDHRELTRAEYDRLVTAARALGREQLALLMETICATGIRVSEVRYITAEAAGEGQAVISLKGKIRTILLPGKLARKLLKYARKNKIASGEIFLAGSGKGMDRRQIWSAMKSVCRAAGVSPSKVFPHNLRHLFARTFYRVCRDIVKLADVLGHSSIETTRIYLVSTGAEHKRELDRLRLVSPTN